MSMTVSCRLSAGKSDAARFQRNHDLRLGKIPDYVDSSKSERNSVILEPPDMVSLRREIVHHRKAAGQQALRTDARLVFRGIITFGSEAQTVINKLSVKEQDDLFTEISDRIAEHFGHEKVGLVVHRDESAIHAHYMLRGYHYNPYTGKETPMRAHKEDFQKAQDIAGAVCKELGISRGTPKAERIKRGDARSEYIHRSMTEMREGIPQDLDKARQRRLDAIKEAEEAEAKRDKNLRLLQAAQEKLDAGKGDVEKLEKNLGIYQNRVQQAADKLLALENEQERLNQVIQARESLLMQTGKRMPKLAAKKQMIGSGLVVSPDDLNGYHQAVADYIQSAVDERLDVALGEEREKLDRREASLTAREQTVDQQEDQWQSANDALQAREKRLDDYETVRTENSRLKTDLSSYGRRFGSIMGIANAGMNAGKVLRAVGLSNNMSEFQAALAKEKLTVGLGRGHGPQ